MLGRGCLFALVTVAVLSSHSAADSAQGTGARAKDLYSRAVELEEDGNPSAALALYWEAAGLAPNDADVQNRLGEALERIGALEPAVDAYRRAIAARPAFRKAANNLILALVTSGKGREAVERARDLVAAAPSDADGHYTLGLAQAEQDVTEAIASFRRALQLAPRHTLARYNLALVLKRADRLSDAADELKRLLAIAPRPEAQYTLGVIYWQQGDLERGAAALRAAIAADPGYADAHYALGAISKAQRDWTGAVDALRHAIGLRPDLVGAHYTLAQVLQLRGDERGAATHFAEAERLRQRTRLEQEASVWTVAGIQRLDRGDSLGAIDHFRHATTVFTDYAPAHYQLGLALQRLGQLDASRAAFARARQLNPSLVPPPDLR